MNNCFLFLKGQKKTRRGPGLLKPLTWFPLARSILLCSPVTLFFSLYSEYRKFSKKIIYFFLLRFQRLSRRSQSRCSCVQSPLHGVEVLATYTKCLAYGVVNQLVSQHHLVVRFLQNGYLATSLKILLDSFGFH